MDAEELELYTFQRRATDLYWAAICSGSEGYTITRILQRFERIDVRWRDGEQKIKCEVVISPAHGVKVGFWEGQGS